MTTIRNFEHALGRKVFWSPRHGDGIDHLLMETRVPLRGRKSVLRQKMDGVEVDGLIDGLAGRIHVEDFDIFPAGTGLQRLLPGQLDDGLVQHCGFKVRGGARVEGIDAQAAEWRVLHGSHAHRLL
jgi:hypothetical protein